MSLKKCGAQAPDRHGQTMTCSRFAGHRGVPHKTRYGVNFSVYAGECSSMSIPVPSQHSWGGAYDPGLLSDRDRKAFAALSKEMSKTIGITMPAKKHGRAAYESSLYGSYEATQTGTRLRLGDVQEAIRKKLDDVAWPQYWLDPLKWPIPPDVKPPEPKLPTPNADHLRRRVQEVCNYWKAA